MKVLVIPEDFRKDQFVLKPIMRAILDCLHKCEGFRGKAREHSCQTPEPRVAQSLTLGYRRRTPTEI